MSDDAATPRPWIIASGLPYRVMWVRHDGHGEVTASGVICDTANNAKTRTPENAANAALIISAVNAQPHAEALAKLLAEVAQHFEDVVDTHKNGDTNNWNSYYLPKFAELATQARAALAEYRRAGECAEVITANAGPIQCADCKTWFQYDEYSGHICVAEQEQGNE